MSTSPVAVRVPPSTLVAPRRTLARWLPAALAVLGALLPACTPAPELDELRSEESFQSNRFLRAIARPDSISEEDPPPEDLENSDESAGLGQRHKGEEGRMGKPTSKSKSGLYAMKGPKDAIPQMARNFDPGASYGVGGLGLVGTGRGGGGTAVAASPYAGGAFAIGNDDADVWGGLTGERYAAIKEASWSTTHAAPLSTFSIDVDTASYANVRRYLDNGGLPPGDAVRVEEMINYFDYGYAAPAGPHPLGVGAEVAPCPWKKGHQLVRVHLQAKTLDAGKIPPRNLVFLIDVSGSMQEDLPLVKRGLELLTDTLRDEDRISIVTYAGASGLVLQPTSGARKEEIKRAIRNLESGGGTNGSAGINLAYAQARRHFVEGGVNRVLLATDGDFNVGVTSHESLLELIEQQRKTGVFLTVLGVGTGNYNDATMEQLADRGNGNYAYLDSEREARKVLVAEASGTLVAVAKDVKLQVEWNPNKVAGYRLVGYENRTLTAEEFNDDKKDAGELGAGDSVTALYEVIPAGRPVPGVKIDALRYQRPAGPAAGELLTLKVRYKQPDGAASTKFEVPIEGEVERWDDVSPQTKLAAAVAAFGLKLRDSQVVANFDLRQAERWIAEAALPDQDGNIAELTRLIELARTRLDQRVVHSRGSLP